MPKNAVLEIRAGAGGDEAGIFAGDLFNMYMRYFEKTGYKTELLTMNPASHGGYKEVSVSVEGENVYGTLKFESGVHRVQRVPATEITRTCAYFSGFCCCFTGGRRGRC